MADLPDVISDPDWVAIGKALLSGFTSNENFSLDGLRQAVVAGATQAHGAKKQATITFAAWLFEKIGEGLETGEQKVFETLMPFALPILAGMFGASVDASALAGRANSDGRSGAARAIVDAFLASVAGDNAGPAEPGDEGARRIATASVNAALEGWFMAAIPDLATDILGDLMHPLDVFLQLPEELLRALGVGRLVRRAIAPLVDATAATPMKWAVEKTYRTQLLAAGTVAKQVARGRMDKDAAIEELARQGYTDDRIEALLNDAAKFHSVADCALLVRSGQWTRGQALQHLQDQGYDPDVADLELTIENIHVIQSFENQLATAAVDAFAAGRIDEGTLGDYTSGATFSDEDGNRFRELAAARKALRNVPLSPSEAEECVLAGILAVADYRQALETAGRSPDAIDALELLLRQKLDKKAALDDLKKQQDADKAAAAQAKATAAAAKEQEVAAKQALARRGSLTDLKRAVVTGLIPISRYEEVLTPNYDADTVQILVDQATQDRADYVANQAKRDDAAKRADNTGLSTAQLEAAVLAGVLTIDQYSAALQAKGLAAGDVSILTSTLAAKKADADKAAATRAAATGVAKQKNINLDRSEQLVRAGIWSMANYDAQLQTLGYDDAQRAALEQLLTSKIAGDGQAAQLRAGVAASAPAKGLSLEQARRAVILGLSSIDDFEAFLQANNYTTDAQQTLIGELRDDVAAAEAAQQKRDQAASATGPRDLPLSTVTKAASLGLISPDVYQARLTQLGYSSDDVALEMELLTTQIADVQAARAKQSAADASAKTPGLTLAQVAAAVKAGVSTLADYQARAQALGLGAADVTTLVRVLGDELDTTKAAKARHDELAGDLTGQNFSLADLEDQVRAGAVTLESYQATLEQKGIAPEDVELLAGLLEDELGS